MGQNLTDVLKERLAKYRCMAAEARECAAKAQTQELKDAFDSLATVWEALGVELQAKPRKRPGRYPEVARTVGSTSLIRIA